MEAIAYMSKENLIDLETRLAFQELAIQELNDALYQQQLRIDQLNQKLEYLQGRLNESQTPGSNTHAIDERPPHY
jgi:SlyX protein